MQQLSLSARPKTLNALIGQKKMVEAIRGHASSGRLPKAWMFVGPTGTGKTTTAKILALSYQCEHQEKFGQPCKECYKNKAAFQIIEFPAATLSTKEDVAKAFKGAEYGVMGAGKYRVYVLDEVHRLGPGAQSLCLDYLESSPATSIFILTTTDPHMVKDTLRGRCQVYELKQLEYDDVLLLVTKLLKIVKSSLPADRLADSLNEHGVRYPRLIAQAVEKYVSGLSPDDAAKVDFGTEIDVKSLTRAVVKGDWESASRFIVNAQPTDMKSIRLSLIAYLKAVLVESPISERNNAVAKAITGLITVVNVEDSVMTAAIAAELYRLIVIFSKYPL